MNEDKIGKKLIQHDMRFANIDAKLLQHDVRLDNIDAKLLQHDDRLDRIEENMFTKEDGRKMMVIIENIATVVKDTRQEQKHMIKWLQRHDQVLGLA